MLPFGNMSKLVCTPPHESSRRGAATWVRHLGGSLRALAFLFAALWIPTEIRAQAASGAAQPGDAEAGRDELARRTFPLGQRLKLRLSNGAMHEGELVRVEPQRHVVLYARGERLRFSWENIAGFTALAAPAEQKAQLKPLSRGQIRAQLIGEASIGLFTKHMNSDGEESDDFVPAECRAGQLCTLSLARTYRAEAPDMKPSYDFRLPDDAGEQVTLRLRSGNSDTYLAGVILAPIAGAVGFTGLILAIAGSPRDDHAMTYGGAAMVAAGVVGAAAGIACVITSKIGVSILRGGADLAYAGVPLGHNLRLTARGLAF